ncbi:MAG: tetratricopeptide repeat protein, partial [Candidatus Rifleibacteriota bacterium]
KAQRIYSELEKLNGDKMSATQKAAQARANIFSSKPDLKKATEILDGLLKADDKNVEAIVLSGQADTEEQKYKPAIEKFEKAIKLDKSNMPAYLGLGHCYLKMNQLEKAIATLSTARDIWPDSFKPLVALGNAYLKNDNLGSALQMFNTAFSMKEQDFEVNLGLLEIFVRSNDPRASIHLEICEKIFKGDPRVEFFKANFLELDEKLLAAKKAYTWLAMYDDETGVRARVRLGQLYTGDGHKAFPGSVLVKNRPTYLDNYRSLANYKLAYNYFQEALDKKTDLKEAAEIKTWLNENEERIGESFQFDSLIQSHFRQ